jgi:hypothetical protein
VFFAVGEETAIVSGKTILLKDDLPKLGAKWDSDARVWRMLAARTDELVAECEKMQITDVEVGAGKPEETESEMLWPREEGKRAGARSED